VELLSEDLGGTHASAVDDLDKIRTASRDVLSVVARLEQRVDRAWREAALDPLTGLPNRRTLQVRAAAIWASDAVVSALVIDVDRFKAINDHPNLGHRVGDEVLVGVADRLRSATRESDVVVRLSGDEFVVLLPGAPLPLARAVSDRIMTAVGTLPVVTSRGPVAVTVSVGAAARGAEDLSVNDLLERADAEMYRVKRASRAGAGAPSEVPPDGVGG
jgi:diguanylate cyclase (GGDEF)-like protein